ncbi:MAG: hypothetical protein Q8N12_05755 [Thermodesulfovibrionales bacterium]|nr:hypothetical protein [Nitrospinota bacterium]MCG2778502.1 hypothetical protein [Desulfobacterales bacterium]MDP3048922.1 hypothetical protein [Thermodesulfovibrionales bacterium]
MGKMTEANSAAVKPVISRLALQSICIFLCLLFIGFALVLVIAKLIPQGWLKPEIILALGYIGAAFAIPVMAIEYWKYRKE